jgi:hypothetical protein
MLSAFSVLCFFLFSFLVTADVTTGIWFCNFYPARASLTVFNGGIDLTASTPDGRSTPIYVVSYPDCKYLANFASITSTPFIITARTSQCSNSAGGLYPSVQYTGISNPRAGHNGAGTPDCQSFTLRVAPYGGGADPEYWNNQLAALPLSSATSADGDNHNIIIARASASNDFGFTTAPATLILDSLIPTVTVYNFDSGAVLSTIDANFNTGTTVRNLLLNVAVPNTPNFLVNLKDPYPGTMNYSGKVDCFYSGFQQNGNQAISGLHYGVQHGAYKFPDSAYVSANNRPDIQHYYLQCYVGYDQYWNTLFPGIVNYDPGLLIGQPILISGSHPKNSVTLTVLHGTGSYNFPFTTSQFTFSGATRTKASRT